MDAAVAALQDEKASSPSCTTTSCIIAGAAADCAGSSTATVMCPKAAGAHSTTLSETAFRQAEKHYKLFRLDPRAAKRQRAPTVETDFADVVDFQNFSANTPANQALMELICEIRKDRRSEEDVEDCPPPLAHLDSKREECKRDAARSDVDSHNSHNSHDNQRCYRFKGVPGLLFFPAALTEAEQRHWAGQSLDVFAQSPPYPNNITTLQPSVRTTGYGDPESAESAVVDSTKTSTTETTTCTTTITESSPSVSASATRQKLRWATLGYKYNWTAKTYDPAQFCEFPPALSALIRRVLRTLDKCVVTALEKEEEGCCDGDASGGRSSDVSAASAPSYQPQTAIVNYFPVGSMMCAHQDLSEPCLHRPLISISLGASAIFLMGTESRDDRPFAFLLRSGDVVAFTGPSRVAYHAVPRIMDDAPSHMTSHEPRMKGLRININVRQVYDEHQPQFA